VSADASFLVIINKSQLSQTNPRDAHVQCDKVATVVGHTKLTTLATTDMPWQKNGKIG